MTSPLFCLPPELQDQIFEYCLQDVDLTIKHCRYFGANNPDNFWHIEKVPDLQFETTCRSFFETSRRIRSNSPEWYRLVLKLDANQWSAVIAFLTMDERLDWLRQNIKILRIEIFEIHLSRQQGWDRLRPVMKNLKHVEMDIHAREIVPWRQDIQVPYQNAQMDFTREKAPSIKQEDMTVLHGLLRRTDQDCGMDVVVIRDFMLEARFTTGYRFAFTQTLRYKSQPDHMEILSCEVTPTDFGEVQKRLWDH